jgi:hypothetical protein
MGSAQYLLLLSARMGNVAAISVILDAITALVATRRFHLL